VIADKAADFLGKSTKAYHAALFRVLRETYVPVMLQRITLPEADVESLLQEYQAVCYQSWGMIKELQTEFEPSIL